MTDSFFLIYRPIDNNANDHNAANNANDHNGSWTF